MVQVLTAPSFAWLDILAVQGFGTNGILVSMTTRRPSVASSAREIRDLEILHLEDSEVDHQLLLAHLARGGVQGHVKRIDSEAEFLAALNESVWDAVISDYNLPGFSGLVALDLLKASGRDLPFILVSGEIGEDTAVAAMRDGASDYLLKNNLARLVPALLQAIDAAETRQARLLADKELDASQERLRELAQHLQASIEQERVSIAREIHDDVGGSLTALKFDLAWIARHATDEAVKLRVSAALETLTLAIDSSKRIMHNLRPAILEQGLFAALQWLAVRFEKRTGVVCTLRLPAGTPELPLGVPLVAYRAAQEALTNVSKHAQATHVRLDLSLAGGVLSLEISDNGCGLTSEDLAKARSFGIRGLHERAATIGGWVEMSSGANGTTLILSVPLAASVGAELTLSEASDSDDPSKWGEL